MHNRVKSKLLRFLLKFNKIFNKIKKPDDFIVTGIPRSGTSLITKILSKSPNCFCFNETYYCVPKLPKFFKENRRKINEGKKVRVKVDENGNLTSDTMKSGVDIKERIIEKKPNKKLTLGLNANIPFLNQIEDILDLNYKVLILIRNPVYSIASWNSKKVSDIPEARVTDDNMHPRWKRFNFKSENQIERQIQIWDHYAKLIYDLSGNKKVKIVKYENLTEKQGKTIEEISNFLNIEMPINVQKLKNMNIDSRYNNINIIEKKIMKKSKARNIFVY